MTRAIHALVDGLPVETVSIDDRGLQYGHGMFETCPVVTPDLSRCSVAGVMRQVLPEQQPGVETRDVAIEELGEAEECFVTNAVIGTWLVARIVGRDRAQLRPGRIARNIMNALEARFGFPRSR